MDSYVSLYTQDNDVISSDSMTVPKISVLKNKTGVCLANSSAQYYAAVLCMTF